MKNKKALVLLIVISFLLSSFSSSFGFEQVRAADIESKPFSTENQTVPIANDQSVTTVQGYYMPIELTGSDPDGDELTFIVVDDPEHGVLYDLEEAPFVTYQSDADYVGSDSFVYRGQSPDVLWLWHDLSAIL